MPKPKLIKFSNEEPTPVPEPEPQPEIFNKKPNKPSRSLKVVVEPESEPEPESESEPEPEPEPQLKKAVKQKKPVSEKQRLHLENIRRKKSEKNGKLPVRPTTTNVPQSQSQRPTTTMGMDDDNEFKSWLKNYEKFDMVLKSREEKARKKQEEEEQKEREMEERIRKKIADEDKERKGISTQPMQFQPVSRRNFQRNNFFGQYFPKE